MEINNLTGVNNAGASKETPKTETPLNSSQQFNPNAQVFQNAANQASVMARIKFKKAETLEENDSEDTENIEMDIPGLGLVKVSKQKLKSFQARIGSAIYRQEEDIKEAIKQFASNDKVLRSTISSILLAI